MCFVSGKKCKKAAEVGLSLAAAGGGDENEDAAAEEERYKQELTECLRTALTELAVQSLVDDDPQFAREVVPSVMNGDIGIDLYLMYSGNPCYTNTNWIQYAAARGDVRLLEAVVALGAALDYPVNNAHHSTKLHVPAPSGSTALVLAMASVAMFKKMERLDPNYYKHICLPEQ